MKVDKALTKVFNNYSDFADVFFMILATKLFEYTDINNHAIEFLDNKQSPYSSIYSLNLIKLEILKAYIKNNLVNEFI